LEKNPPLFPGVLKLGFKFFLKGAVYFPPRGLFFKIKNFFFKGIRVFIIILFGGGKPLFWGDFFKFGGNFGNYFLRL